MRESKIEKALTEGAERLGAVVRKLKWIGRDGAPDRVVMFSGWTVWVELKRPGEVPRPIQENEHRLMRRAGQDVRVIDTLDGVDEFLRELETWPIRSTTRGPIKG